ncbi:MAG: hypothetical protein IJS68_03220, partial [Clostridia bacterium]|nr:hypothetical protein [Clostridia bacterium]
WAVAYCFVYFLIYMLVIGQCAVLWSNVSLDLFEVSLFRTIAYVFAFVPALPIVFSCFVSYNKPIKNKI